MSVCLSLVAMAPLRVASFLPCPSCTSDKWQRDLLFAFLQRQKRFNWESTRLRLSDWGMGVKRGLFHARLDAMQFVSSEGEAWAAYLHWQASCPSFCSGGAWGRPAVQSGRAAGRAGGPGRGQPCPMSSGQREGAKRAAAGWRGERLVTCCLRRRWWLGAGIHDGAV